MGIIPNASFALVGIHFSGFPLYNGAVTTIGTDWSEVDTMANAAALMAEKVGDLVPELCPTTVTCTHIEVKFGPNATGPTYVVPVDVDGTVGGQALTGNTAYLIRKVHGEVSGRYDGRMYWPVPTDSSVSASGALIDGFVETFDTALAAFMLSWQEDIGNLYIFSATASDPKQINQLRMQPRAATQRRRMRK